MTKSDPRLGGLNIILIGVVSVLYMLLVTKLAEMMSTAYDDPESQISVYVTLIYILSIMGMVVGYAYLSDDKSRGKPQVRTPNWILRWSFNVGGVLLLIYSITNYWDFMGEYTKLSLLALSIICVVYYIYKFYEN